MVTAVGIGAVSAVIGLLISYHHATATGATMALVTVIVFIARPARPPDRAAGAGGDRSG